MNNKKIELGQVKLETTEHLSKLRDRLLNFDNSEDRAKALKELEDYQLDIIELENREQEEAQTDLNNQEFQDLVVFAENIRALEAIVNLKNTEGLQRFVPEWKRLNKASDWRNSKLEELVGKIEATIQEIERLYPENKWPLLEKEQNELYGFLEKFCQDHKLNLLKNFRVAKQTPACELRKLDMKSGRAVHYPDNYTALMLYGPSVLKKT